MFPAEAGNRPKSPDENPAKIFLPPKPQLSPLHFSASRSEPGRVCCFSPDHPTSLFSPLSPQSSVSAVLLCYCCLLCVGSLPSSLSSSAAECPLTVDPCCWCSVLHLRQHPLDDTARALVAPPMLPLTNVNDADEETGVLSKPRVCSLCWETGSKNGSGFRVRILLCC